MIRKRILIVGIVWLVFIWAVPVVAAKTVYADQYGYDATDATSALQSALDDVNASTVIVKNMGAPWIVRPILIRRDNLTVIFNKGVVLQAKSGGFPGANDCLVSCDARSHITMIGYGATFRMLKGEYTTGEWRHCLKLESCSNVTISGLTCRDSGGDGFYIGVSKKTPSHPYCENIVIKDCTADNNRRNGFSVISAKNLVISGCTSKNSSGTQPEAGIDFEPNTAKETLSNCVVRNSRFVGNRSCQFEVALGKLDISRTVSITAQNCHFSNDGVTTAYGAAISGANAEMPGGGCRGLVELSDCTFTDIAREAYRLRNNANGMLARLTRCTFKNVGTAKGSIDMPICLVSRSTSYCPEYGNLQFTDCTFYDPANAHKYFLGVGNEPKASLGCANISGNIRVVTPDGAHYYLGANPHSISLKANAVASE